MKYTICGSCEYTIEVDSSSSAFKELIEIHSKDDVGTDNQYDTAEKVARELVFDKLSPATVELDEISIYGIWDKEGNVVIET